jgi:hypothetical protein
MKGARKVFREWPANYWPNNSLLLRIYWLLSTCPIPHPILCTKYEEITRQGSTLSSPMSSRKAGKVKVK